jgi:hypothetical protein
MVRQDDALATSEAVTPVRRRSLFPFPFFVYVIVVFVVSALFGSETSHPWWQQILEGVGVAWLCINIVMYARWRGLSRRA